GETGEVRLPFRLDPTNRPYQVYDPVHGKMGVSGWRRIEVRGSRTLVAFTPLTGRTHQLRLHASHPLGLGYPIVGDRL
ncbi:RluA family pseudouridine synthase, partial [Citrobacter sp. AAK_AS5]